MVVNSGTLQQLLGKRRTYEDLSRFIGQRITGVPNYALLLGAGCSVSSGVRSGSELVDEWRREVFARLCPGIDYAPQKAIDHLNKNEAAWYNSAKEYSSLFERIYDLPRQRRMFVEKEVSNKDPNLGYAYLTKLVDKGFINTIFTTNFDDLLNESFFRFSQTRPVVCAHDSSISSITVTSQRPKIVKMHGDYLFDDIKSTVRETESLEENTRKKFIEFGRDFGLVVIGYNGGDRSVMEVLQYLLRGEEYFKNGIYWCIRKGEQPSEELTKLLWKDRVYYVEIDGFDETMAALHNDMVGPSLPVDTSLFTDRPREIIAKFCSNEFLAGSPSPIIRRDLAKLKVQESREHFLSAMRDMRNSADERGEKEGDLSDRHMVQLLEISRLIKSDDFSKAKDKISEALATADSLRFSEDLYLTKIRAEELSGDTSSALATIDKLIEIDPNNSEWLIRKSYLLRDFASQWSALDRAEQIDSENYRVHDRKLDCLIDAYDSVSPGDAKDVIRQIDEVFNLSIKYDPSLRNDSWPTIISFMGSVELSRAEFLSRCTVLINKCKSLGLCTTSYLHLLAIRHSKIESDRDSPEADDVLKSIANCVLAKPRMSRIFFQWLELDALSLLKRKTKLRSKLVDLSSDGEYSSKRGYLKRHSEFLIVNDGDLCRAIEKMRSALGDRVMSVDIIRLSTFLKYQKNASGIRDLKQRYWASLDSVDRLRVGVEECEAGDDFEGALQYLRQIANKRKPSLHDTASMVHELIILDRSAEARALAKERLIAIDWNKTTGGELIVNYELAKRRLGEKVDKSRLGEVAELNLDGAIAGCCYYLMDLADKAKKAFLKALDDDREVFFMMQGWAIFNDQDGASFLARLRPAWYQDAELVCPAESVVS